MLKLIYGVKSNFFEKWVKIMKKSILKTAGVVAVLVLIIGDRIGNGAADVQTAKYQEPRAVVTNTDEQLGSIVIIEDEPVALSANPFETEKDAQSVSDNSLD